MTAYLFNTYIGSPLDRAHDSVRRTQEYNYSHICLLANKLDSSTEIDLFRIHDIAREGNYLAKRRNAYEEAFAGDGGQFTFYTLMEASFISLKVYELWGNLTYNSDSKKAELWYPPEYHILSASGKYKVLDCKEGILC